MKLAGRSLRFERTHKLTVALDERRYELVHARARVTGLTPSQIVFAALRHVATVKHDEWLVSPKKIAKELRKKGMTLIEIAGELNRQGFRTRNGKTFRPDTVWRLLSEWQRKRSKANSRRTS